MQTNYHIFNGDCLRFIEQLPKNTIDAIITDPPYSSGGNTAFRQNTRDKYAVGLRGKTYPLFQGDNRDQLSQVYWLQHVLSACCNIAKPDADLLVFSDWRQLHAMIMAVQAAGFTYIGLLAWDKTPCARPNKGRFNQRCEFVIHAIKGNPARRGQYLQGAFQCSSQKGGKCHQTGKPVAVMNWLIELVPEGGAILDPFMGSGSTGVAALEQKRGLSFFGAEMSCEYFDIAQQRLEVASGG